MKVLLAVSGGIDSMYMLHRAPELFPGASFAAAHCNFGLRGDESDGDEEFVISECRKMGVGCFVKRFDTIEYAAANGVSVEMAARELRYGWFRELCRDHGFDALATAHNANDNAETLILNLLRGTGTKGLRGIPSGFTPQFVHLETSASLHPSHCPSGPAGPSRSHGHGRPWFRDGQTASVQPEESSYVLPPFPSVIPSEGEAGVEKSSSVLPTSSSVIPSGGEAGVEESPAMVVVRPILDVSRDDIRDWMVKNGYGWREDRTNAENEARRNKIRNMVFPVFARINPSFIRTLGEDMERFRQTDDIADDYFREAAARIVKYAPEAHRGAILQISVTGLLALKHWRYVLWRILEDCSFSAETFDKLCTLLERYRTEPAGTVTLSGKTFQAPAHTLRALKKLLLLY